MIAGKFMFSTPSILDELAEGRRIKYDRAFVGTHQPFNTKYLFTRVHHPKTVESNNIEITM